MNYFTKNNDISHESGGISIPKRSITAIAIALIIAGLSLVGCPDNTGSGDGTGDGTDTGTDTTAPAQITGLAQMRSVDSTSVTLSWTNPADTDLETIRITVDPALPDFPLDVEANGASMEQSEIVTRLDAGTDYTFAVLTIDAAENESASSGAPTVTALGDTAPAQVTGLTQTRSADGTSVTLSWTNPADADLETVRITVTPSISGFPLAVDANGASMSQSEVVTGLDATNDYYTFTVRTIDTAGNVSASSVVGIEGVSTLEHTLTGNNYEVGRSPISSTASISNRLANAFITGAATAGYQLTEVSVILTGINGDPMALRVAIHAAAADGTPGAMLAGATEAMNFVTGGFTAGTKTIPFSPSIRLEPTTTYFVVFTAPSAGDGNNQYQIQRAVDDLDTASPGWSIANDGYASFIGAAWEASTIGPVAFSVTATVNSD